MVFCMGGRQKEYDICEMVYKSRVKTDFFSLTSCLILLEEKDGQGLCINSIALSNGSESWDDSEVVLYSTSLENKNHSYMPISSSTWQVQCRNMFQLGLIPLQPLNMQQVFHGKGTARRDCMKEFWAFSWAKVFINPHSSAMYYLEDYFLSKDLNCRRN